MGFFGINIAILYGSQSFILQATDVSKVYDVLIIPGASVAGLKLSAVLQDRVETAIQLYKSGKAKKLMVSGDNGTKYYDEVTAMYTYIVNR
ncbi:MAG: YdcF family protein [bacterium]